MEPMPTRDVMGMRIPLPLAARIIAAMRAEYPTVVNGLNDDAAVRAVVRYWVTTTLANHEAKVAAEAAQVAVADAQEQLETAASTAHERAMSDAIEQIVEIPAEVQP